MKQLLLLAGSFVVGSLSAQAQLVFSEGFESYAVAAGSGVTVQTPNTFGPWSVSAGSIDILDTYPGLAPRTGVQNLDMDGSTNSAGTITRTFTATAGVTYTLTYYYAGNQRQRGLHNCLAWLHLHHAL